VRFFELGKRFDRRGRRVVGIERWRQRFGERRQRLRRQQRDKRQQRRE
jgi:hypothetical protein